MPKLVYLPTLAETWLHWSSKGNASCLRDYRSNPATEKRDLTTREIDALLSTPNAAVKNAENVRIDDQSRWRRIVSGHNVAAGLPPIAELPSEDLDEVGLELSISRRDPSLVARFQEEASRLLEHGRHHELATVLKSWTERLVCIKNKTSEFNHWDHDDATKLNTEGSGIGWTSRWLEYCRMGGERHYITVDGGVLDLSLISMELNLRIAKRDNLFRDQEFDSVNPDAIGVRRDSTLGVLEVKGPQDEHDWEKATLQALCGALALYAKREMIVTLASLPAQRRVVANAHLPATGRSIGLYVFIDAPLAADATKMRALLDACPLIREIILCPLGASSEPESMSATIYRA